MFHQRKLTYFVRGSITVLWFDYVFEQLGSLVCFQKWPFLIYLVISKNIMTRFELWTFSFGSDNFTYWVTTTAQ